MWRIWACDVTPTSRIGCHSTYTYLKEWQSKKVQTVLGYLLEIKTWPPFSNKAIVKRNTQKLIGDITQFKWTDVSFKMLDSTPGQE